MLDDSCLSTYNFGSKYVGTTVFVLYVPGWSLTTQQLSVRRYMPSSELGLINMLRFGTSNIITNGYFKTALSNGVYSIYVSYRRLRNVRLVNHFIWGFWILVYLYLLVFTTLKARGRSLDKGNGWALSKIKLLQEQAAIVYKTVMDYSTMYKRSDLRARVRDSLFLTEWV